MVMATVKLSFALTNSFLKAATIQAFELSTIER
jgi:hypothetical protein